MSGIHPLLFIKKKRHLSNWRGGALVDYLTWLASVKAPVIPALSPSPGKTM